MPSIQELYLNWSALSPDPGILGRSFPRVAPASHVTMLEHEQIQCVRLTVVAYRLKSGWTLSARASSTFVDLEPSRIVIGSGCRRVKGVVSHAEELLHRGAHRSVDDRGSARSRDGRTDGGSGSRGHQPGAGRRPESVRIRQRHARRGSDGSHRYSVDRSGNSSSPHGLMAAAAAICRVARGSMSAPPSGGTEALQSPAAPRLFVSCL